MSQFYFHFLHGAEREEDAIGLALPDAETAYLQAVDTVRSIGSELIAAGMNPADCAFEIADAEGRTLFSVAFNEFFTRRPVGSPAPEPLRADRQFLEMQQETNRLAAEAEASFVESLLQTKATIAQSQSLIAQLGSYAR